MTQRPLTPHDLLDLEALSAAALSPNGPLARVVHTRPRRTATFHKYDYLLGGDRRDQDSALQTKVLHLQKGEHRHLRLIDEEQ